MTNLPHVDIWTDGASSGNPGTGGWAAILVASDDPIFPTVKELSGSAPGPVGNNVMELRAIFEGIVALERPCAVTIYTDSNNAIGWLARNWKRKDLLIDHWVSKILRAILAGGHAVAYVKVAGHGSELYNERADLLAKTQAGSN